MCQTHRVSGLGFRGLGFRVYVFLRASLAGNLDFFHLHAQGDPRSSLWTLSTTPSGADWQAALDIFRAMDAGMQRSTPPGFKV